MQATWKRLVSRPGWTDVDAVKNNRVYVMDPFAANACSKMVGACYLAKWLYPDRFPDLDPDALMKEWLENFQGVTYPGSYVFIPE
jgi:iron complex transport system substrate-binding protein